MDFYDQKQYKESEEYFGDKIKKGANFLIVTIPGLGASYLVRKFLEKNKSAELKYIDKPGESLGRFNFLDLNFDKDGDAPKVVDEYFKRAELDQKFAVIVNKPGWLASKQFKESFVSSHVYGMWNFRARELEDVEIFAGEMDSELTNEQIVTIYELSGGIGRLVKYLALNKRVLDDPDVITEEARVLMRPMAESVLECSSDVLERLGLVDNGQLKSKWLEKYIKELKKEAGLDIVVGEDLVVEEDGNKTGEILSVLEKQIIEYMIAHEGVIAKERIADFKWGEGSYDKYSDQAIGKTMQRLEKKLHSYQLTALPKVGYKLARK